ncbi:DUF4227 family protein [Brevibacillus sp. TJ4]|uniref:DUF4227 family protein n=1 Tax=Brevibacillus sp. TJ4 TaxID=3234853 RepID=UPI0037CECA2B
MKTPYYRMMEVLRFLLLLVTCTLLSYALIAVLAKSLLPDHHQLPAGDAVKVAKLVNATEPEDLDGYAARLQLFYMTGE